VNFEPSSLEAVLGADSDARHGAAQDIEKLN
jgi:hypothetical protein